MHRTHGPRRAARHYARRRAGNLPGIGPAHEQALIKPEALRKSEGIFITQSALGIIPVAAFNGEPVAPSPLVDQIACAYGEILIRP